MEVGEFVRLRSLYIPNLVNSHEIARNQELALVKKLNSNKIDVYVTQYFGCQRVPSFFAACVKLGQHLPDSNLLACL